MKLRTILLGLTGLVVVGGIAAAVVHFTVMKPRHEAMRAAIASLVAEMDADKDAKLSRPEVDAALATRFAAADANADGKIDRTEFDAAAAALRAKFPAPPWGRDPSERLARAFKALDWNRDDGLQIEEVRGVVQAAAGFADRDADGFIASDELRGPWRRGHGMRHAGFF